MHRPPPSHTLFPYTTLFRSQVPRRALGGRQTKPQLVEPPRDRQHGRFVRVVHRHEDPPGERQAAVGGIFVTVNDSDKPTVLRSEEHTSELQSPCNLVFRLLL